MSREPMEGEGAGAQDRRLSAEQGRVAEAHRGFVREMDRSLGNAYGTGGATVLALGVALGVVGWWMGWLTSPILWVAGVTAVLAALYAVRRRIYAHRDRLRQRIAMYCDANDVDVETLRLYFEEDQTYSFFNDIYRRQPGQGLDSSPQVGEGG